MIKTKGKAKAQMTDTHQNHIKHTPVIIKAKPVNPDHVH